jgi:hypothetical protein
LCRAPIPPPCPLLPFAGFFAALASPFLRGVKKSATSLVAASVRASATMMSPNTWAVAADMFSARVKVPACGELVSAMGLPGVPMTGVGVGTGAISGRSLATFAGVNNEVVTLAGVGKVTGGSTVASPGALTGLTCATGVDAGLVGVFFGDALADADADAATLTDCDAVGMTVMAGLVAASAVAVSVTEVTELAEEATGIWACSWYATGATEVPSDPTAHVADPFPPGQRSVNVAVWPEGDAASVTDTPDAEPFCAETWTVNDAAWPRLTPDWDACTLTHSSACGAVGEADGEADEAAGATVSGSHCELAAAAASAIPGRPPARPHAADPAPMRQAASTRPVRRRIGTILFLPFTGIPARIRRPARAPR